MPYQLYKVVNFSSANAGLSTVGYTVEGQRRTAGVADLLGGAYGALITFNQPGPIVWDTGGSNPVRFVDVLNPVPTAPEIADSVWDEPRSGHVAAGTFGESLEVEVAYNGGVQSATATTIVLGSNEPTTSDYKGWGVSIHSGKGAGQYRTLNAYTASSRAGVIDRPWDTTPDMTSVYRLWSPVSVSLNADKSGYALSGAGLDGVQVEAGVNARQALSPILAASAGVLLGAGTGTIVVKGGNSSVTRISASTDNAGNRTSVTLTLPA